MIVKTKSNLENNSGIKIIKASEHYKNEMDWLSTYHHFSFADYQNPDKMNFGPLRVFNDDIIQPATGFDFHLHRDMEIITYVIEGELEHKDNQGNHGVIYPGEVQRMTAGSGIMHSEFNHSKEKPLRLLQMWVFTNKKGLTPSWEQKKFSKEERTNKLVPVIVSENTKNTNALHIHQDAAFYLSTLTPGNQIEHKLSAGRKSYLFVIDGEIKLNNNLMQTRDAAMIENENNLVIKAEKPTELILIDLPEKYVINN
ncbi:MAG TPA: pirin family protein [Nitrosopumilaceae archaeon]|nr:pirin family protein [Nitrosopumilaceae archaeon]